jgi:hypothetical protein
MLDVSGKDDQTAHFGLTQKLTVFAGQPGAGDIDHQGALQARTHRKTLTHQCSFTIRAWCLILKPDAIRHAGAA